MGGRLTDTVKTLLIANVLFFFGTAYLGDYAFKVFALWFPENENFAIWQILTHMFMHGNTSHIFFNMFMLFIFGSVMEQSIGQKRFIFLYISAGLGAAALQILFNYINFTAAYQTYIEAGFSDDYIKETLQYTAEMKDRMKISSGVPKETTQTLVTSYLSSMVGASGAIFGLLAGFAMLYPNLQLYLLFIPIPIKAKYLIGAYFLLDLYAAITGASLLGESNIAHWAHIGGAVVGFFMVLYWKKNDIKNRWN